MAQKKRQIDQFKTQNDHIIDVSVSNNVIIDMIEAIYFNNWNKTKAICLLNISQLNFQLNFHLHLLFFYT